MNNDYIANLREAVAQSPTNIPLRLMLAEALAGKGLHEEAEQLLKGNLQIDTQHHRSRLLLARSHYNKGSFSVATVIVEELLNEQEDAQVLCLYALLQLHDKQLDRAASYYQQAKALDNDLFEEDLEPLIREKTMEAAGDDADEETAENGGKFGRLDRPDLRFSDVGGMERVKDDIRIKIILPQENRALFEAYGKKAGGGVLLYGPPGCGKTYLAKATAGEISSTFISVGINEIMDMYVGASEKNVHELFETARKQKPCVLFFDEVDALGASRSDTRQSAGRNVINQFLAEMDGISSNNDDLLVMGATNAPWHLDPAFRRPGRFDNILFIPPPDEAAKIEILQLQLRGKPQENINAEKVVAYMKDFSGADIKAVVDRAVEEKLREAMLKGTVFPLTTNDLVTAATHVKASTHEWFMTAKNYAVYANESGIYDEILDYLKIKK